MPEAIGPAQWAALRDLSEGEMPTDARLAAAADMHITTLSQRAALDGWKKLDCRRKDVQAAFHERIEMLALPPPAIPMEPPPTAGEAAAGATAHAASGTDFAGPAIEPGPASVQPEEKLKERLARLSKILLRQADHLIAYAERRGAVLTRQQLDMVLAMTRAAEKWEALAEEQTVEREEKSNAERATALEKVNAKIIELARQHAALLVRRKSER